MDLAIVNLTNTVVAWKLMRLPPGGKVRLTSWYSSEEEARKDLTLMKFVNTGKASICLVDFDGINSLSEKIAELEARADEERDAGNAARRAKRLEHRAYRKERQLARQASRHVDRRKLEQESAQRVEVDLSALYETTRKARLAQVMREDAEKKDSKIPHPYDQETLDKVDAVRFVDGVDTYAVPAEPEPVDFVTELVEERLGENPELEEMLEKAEENIEVLRAFEQAHNQVVLDLLSDDQLHAILDAFETKGRHLIKKHSSLVKAVERLNLNSQDLVQLLQQPSEKTDE